jgi:hypothetical protein
MSGSLPHAPCEIIAKLLIDLNLANIHTSDTWPVRSYSEPEEPDNHITVFDTTGVIQGTLQPSGELIEFVGCQIKIRSNGIPEGRIKADNIAIALDGLALREVTLTHKVTQQEITYVIPSVNRTGSIIPVGFDKPASKRFIHTINLLTNTHKKGV